MTWKSAIGQDSHRFDETGSLKKLILGGVEIPSHRGLKANSDGDVILHAITNAVSGITGINVLGFEADALCEEGIKDSQVYLKKALSALPPYKINHLSVSVECGTPVLKPYLEKIKIRIARILEITVAEVGLTATSGEGLTDFGKGLGIQCFVVLTVSKS